MYDINQMIDSIIEEQYALFKGLISGNYTAFCTLYQDIMGKLSALRDGVKKDAEAKNKIIEDLKAQLNCALQPQEMPENGGIIGGETVTLDFTEREE